MTGFLCIAGHAFDDSGVCRSVPPCGIKLSLVRTVDESCLDQPGYAHIGKLNASELNEVRAFVAVERAACEAATRDIASGGYCISEDT
jgi:hypothetical protein